MAKYITLTGLSRFLSNLKSNKFQASINNFGAIKIGYNGGNADTANKNYPVKLSDGKAYVYVPWENDDEIKVNANHGISMSNNKLTLDLVDSTKSGVSSTTPAASTFNQNKFYAIQLDKNNKLSVNVPWEDTAVTSVDNHYSPNGTDQTQNLGLYKFTNDNTGHITGVVNVSKSDITKFNIYSQTTAASVITNLVENVTYEQLTTKIKNNELYPGKKYCITDYTVVLPSTISPAGNSVTVTSTGFVFGIIVKAKTVNSLYSDAQACSISNSKHEYFELHNINALKIKYDINNSTAKYSWANSTSGKGVIYYMKDEFCNETPYDFLNIKFNGKYTFTHSSHNNIIKPYEKDDKRYLNNITEIGNNCSFSYNCHDIHNESDTIECDYNTMGDNCKNISFKVSTKYNTIGNNCSNITFGSNYITNCDCNTIGNNCSNINFGEYNYVGNYIGNIVGSICNYNTIGNNCSDISFGYGNIHNTIGDNCSDITLGYGWICNEFVDNISDFSIYYKFNPTSTSDNAVEEKKLRVMNCVISCKFNKNIKKIFLSDFSAYKGSQPTKFDDITVKFFRYFPTIFEYEYHQFEGPGTSKKYCYNAVGICGIEFVELYKPTITINEGTFINLPLDKICFPTNSNLNDFDLFATDSNVHSTKAVITGVYIDSWGNSVELIKLKLPTTKAITIN